MLIIFTLLWFILIFFTTMIFKRKINPFNIYFTIWYIAFFCHDFGFVNFYKISKKTFLIIVLTQIVVFTGSIFGNILANGKNKNYELTSKDKEDRIKIIKKILIFTSILSLIEILPDFVSKIRIYGYNLIANAGNLYFDGLTQVKESSFSLSSFIYLSATFIGIYMTEKGLDKVVIFRSCR